MAASASDTFFRRLSPRTRATADLRRELGREVGRDTDAIRLDQGQVFSVHAKREVGVQRQAGHGPVLARREHRQKTARRHVGRRKTPLGQVAGGVGEEPAAQVHGVGRGVADLYPIRVCPVFILQSRGILGEKLADKNRFAGLDIQNKDERESGDAQMENRTEKSNGLRNA